MRDVSRKGTSLRTAVARSILHVSPDIPEIISSGKVPKGDPLPVARVAGIQAAKQTSMIIPFCHPIPIDHADCSFEVHNDRIEVTATVTAIHKTGVEMEALTAASVAALTLYDMLKPVDDGLSIGEITLLSKIGGRSDHASPPAGLKAAIVVLSDSASAGKRNDESGKYIEDVLRAKGIAGISLEILPDEKKELKAKLEHLADSGGMDLILTTGGTGLGPRDTTPETTAAVIDREAPGIAEAIRSYGQERLPTAMLGRARAGLRGRTLIVNLPGSVKAVQESLDAILPGIFHAMHIIRGGGHDAKSDQP